ncbi:hypothetical protein [Treponema primitia]|uniref:hypothetical protein n=1 Tax=Treponema primitia TaxID=88058 RepID=UPI0002555166|nr:hypothetical protein [Treponema primitia]
MKRLQVLTLLSALALVPLLLIGCDNATGSSLTSSNAASGDSVGRPTSTTGPTVTKDEADVLIVTGTIGYDWWEYLWKKTGKKTLILKGNVTLAANTSYNVPVGGTLKFDDTAAVTLNLAANIVLNAAHSDIILTPNVTFTGGAATEYIFVKDDATRALLAGLATVGAAGVNVGAAWDGKTKLSEVSTTDLYIQSWTIDTTLLDDNTKNVYIGSATVAGDLDLTAATVRFSSLVVQGDPVDPTTPNGVLTAKNNFTYTGVAAATIPTLDLNGKAVTLANAVGLPSKITSTTTGGTLGGATTGILSVGTVEIAAGKDITLASSVTNLNLNNGNGAGTLIVPGNVTAATVTAGTANVSFTRDAGVTLGTATFGTTGSVNFAGPVKTTGAATFAGDATFNGVSEFGNTVTLGGATAFNADVFINNGSAVTGTVAKAITLKATKAIKIHDPAAVDPDTDITLVKAGAANLVLDPVGPTALTGTYGTKTLAVGSGILNVTGGELSVEQDVTLSLAVDLRLTNTKLKLNTGVKLTGVGNVEAGKTKIAGDTGWAVSGTEAVVTIESNKISGNGVLSGAGVSKITLASAAADAPLKIDGVDVRLNAGGAIEVQAPADPDGNTSTLTLSNGARISGLDSSGAAKSTDVGPNFLTATTITNLQAVDGGSGAANAGNYIRQKSTGSDATLVVPIGATLTIDNTTVASATGI